MIEVIIYKKEYKEQWDNFITRAKNGTFLFYRDYMEYHADRFEDYSLMLFEKGKLKSVFPANRINDTLYSHQGLTFAGIITLYETDTLKYIDYFNAYNHFVNVNGIYNIVYKAIPQIYKTHPGDEELYALFRVKAEIRSTNLSSCIDLKSPILISRNRKRNFRKSEKMGITTKPSLRWEDFWEIMTENMQIKHGAKPVHSCNEMQLLKKKFPEKIELLEATINGDMIAGAVIYKYDNIIKVQYAHASDEGKDLCAIDNIYNYLITTYKNDTNYIDFGTSNLDNGLYINNGLLRQKEGFGARGVIFNSFRYSTNKYID